MESGTETNHGRKRPPVTGRRARGFPSRAVSLLASLALTVAVGCAAGKQVRLPPLDSDPSGQVHAGKFVWIDLLTEDVSKASAFYSGLFGWRAATSKEDKEYLVFFKGNKQIGGMAAAENQDDKGSESLWLVSLSVDDVDRAVAMCTKSGGKLLEGPVDAKKRGRMALVSDPAGAPLILMRASGGDPPDRPVASGEWLWTDLFTQDAGKAGDFYKSLAGYQAEWVEGKEDHQYYVLKRDGRGRAGIVELEWEGLEDNWLPYFRVDDVEQTVKKASQLGGTLILKSGKVAILSDPTGAAFGVQSR